VRQATGDVRLQLSIAFRSRGLDGVVRVTVRPNNDPRATGHDEVAPNFDEEAFKGFPLVSAKVDYPGEGPRGWFAWIQWIAHVRSGRVIAEELDTPPWLDGPFYVIGYRPTFADAPSNPDHLDLDWVATTYLTITEPSAADDPAAPSVLIPLAGFVWGYRRSGGTSTELLPPVVATDESWADLERLLAGDSRWTTRRR
jgi:hypothetical protein